jgi:hypothetical protein
VLWLRPIQWKAQALQRPLICCPQTRIHCRLYFAVPEYRFDKFAKQVVEPKNGTALQRPVGRVARVRQFVLRVVC